jgi:cutinase
VNLVRRIARVLSVGVMAIGALLCLPVPSATAQPCPDVEVVFARGTNEPPGVGPVGQAFVDSLRTQLGAKSLNVYGVNYPASSDFGNRIAFAKTVVDGIRDAGQHVMNTANACPNTKIVLGGFSQGAAVSGFVTSEVIPEGIPDEYKSQIPDPMPPEVASHVAAVTLIGTPSDRFLSDIGAPALVIGPLYAPKTLKVCANDDTICNGAPVAGPPLAHGMYPFNGMTNEAATYAASRV